MTASSYGSAHPPPRPPRASAAPLVLAGVALLLTAWLTADRMGWFRPALDAEPRAVTPRGSLADFETAVIEVFEQNRQSVVHITTEKVVRGFFGHRRVESGTGSGFVWDDKGVIVTNAHVVSGEAEVKVAFGEGTFDAEVLARDKRNDIAVVRLRRLPEELHPVAIGTSHDLRIGQTAIAIGNPFGLDQTLSVGVVSQLDRTIETRETVVHGMIQTDAAINPGNSGGPLLDSAGRLIGMNTAIYSPTGTNAGIGFAVPVDTVNEIVPELIAGGEARPQLGVVLRPVRAGGRVGLLVEEVVGDVARRAGLRPYDEDRGTGDIVIGLDGTRVRSASDLRLLMRDKVHGDEVRIHVLRVTEEGSYEDTLEVELR